MSCIMICTSVLAAFPLQAYATSGTISETELDSSAGIYLEDKASVMLSNSTNKGNLKSLPSGTRAKIRTTRQNKMRSSPSSKESTISISV